MSKQFFYKLLALSSCVLLLELAGLQVAVMGKTGGKVFNTIKVVDLPATFILQMATFIVVVLLLHALVLAYAWLSARASLSILRLQGPAAENIGLVTFLLAWVAIFLLNNAFITRSIFAYWGEFSLGPLGQNDIALLAGALALSPSPIIAWWAISSLGRREAVGLAAAIAVFALMLGPALGSKDARAGSGKPNIIVIGIDSFRPEYLNPGALMPRMSALLADAAVFSEVYTPLARTFPSWTSMLSGLHPLETGARVNLIDPELVRRDAMITWQLRDAGYHTMLATDERRFSNLDKSYGFDAEFGPAAGAADFVLGLAGDFPLVNLLASTGAGSLLFPYLADNRAVSRLYRPEKFTERLGRELQNSPAKPLFLMTHLCLPHWPYSWAGSPPATAGSEAKSGTNSQELALINKTQTYESALAAVDRQIAILLDSLQASGHLDDAIVILLTDHGEGIGWPGETLVNVEDPSMPLASKNASGHGTNVFALVQHHTFMAFRRYGAGQYIPGKRQQRFFNYDLGPTLLDLLDLRPADGIRGISMVPWLERPALEGTDRALFVETGFYLPAINTVTIKIDDVISQGRNYYLINDDARLIINPAKMGKLIGNKQRGVLRGSLLLAQVPVEARGTAVQYEWVLADIAGGGAVKLVADNFTAECRTQCMAMLEELIAFYGAELAIEEWPAYSQYLQATSVADNKTM